MGAAVCPPAGGHGRPLRPGGGGNPCLLYTSWGLKVSERRLAIDEVAEAYDKGLLKECFGTGTAAVVSPVGELKWGDKVMEIGGGQIGPVSQRLYDTLTGIQWGKIEGPAGWSVEVCK